MKTYKILEADEDLRVRRLFLSGCEKFVFLQQPFWNVCTF